MVDLAIYKYRKHPQGFIGHRESFKLKFPDNDGEKEWAEAKLLQGEPWLYLMRVEETNPPENFVALRELNIVFWAVPVLGVKMSLVVRYFGFPHFRFFKNQGQGFRGEHSKVFAIGFHQKNRHIVLVLKFNATRFEFYFVENRFSKFEISFECRFGT